MRKTLPINLQFFAEGGDGNGDQNAGSNNNGHEGNANAKGRWLDDYLKGGKKRNFAPDTFAKLYKKNAGL